MAALPECSVIVVSVGSGGLISGIASAAALITNKLMLRANAVVCAVLAGGHIDGHLVARVLEQVLVHDRRSMLLKLATVDRTGALSLLCRL
jgi:threonine dehydratase